MCRSRLLAVMILALALGLPARAPAQTTGTTSGGTTSGGTTTTNKQVATPMKGTTTGTTTSGMGNTTITGTVGQTITLNAFEQMLLADIEEMLTKEFGPIPPEVLDYVAGLILREIMYGPPPPSHRRHRLTLPPGTIQVPGQPATPSTPPTTSPGNSSQTPAARPS